MRGNRKPVFREKILPLMLSIALIIALLPVQVHAASEVIRRGSTDKMQVALTFDDGYDPVNTSKVLDVLAAHDIVATFFLNGKAIENNPKQARRVVKEGHELANHSYSHQRLTEISSSEVLKEISLTEKAAKEVTGKDIGGVFRVPFGAFNQEVLNLLEEAGYPYTIQWTIDPRDWEGPPAKAIHDQVMREMKPGAIVVLHVNYDSVNTAAALPGIIKDLKAQGYEFVTISEMIFGTEIGGIHRVKRGETLYGIADQYGVSADVLVDINDLEDLNVIKVGQRLYIPKEVEDDTGSKTEKSEPGPESGTKSASEPDSSTDPKSSSDQAYTVQAGDSLQRIAEDFDITLESLLIANRIRKVESIFVGQSITIPSESPDPSEENIEEGEWLDPEDYKNVWREAGDALHRLASDYRVTVEQLIFDENRLNQIIYCPQSQIQLR